MNRIIIFLLLTAHGALGKAAENVNDLLPARDGILITHTLYATDITLTREEPYSRELGITFLGIGDDGYAYLRFKNEKTFKTTKGKAFACEEFGRRGLLYISSAPDKSSITLRRFTCETTETKSEKENEPNKAVVPIPVAVTTLAFARVAPSTSMAHL